MAPRKHTGACAAERIHEPGSIQPHGCLLVLGIDLVVLQVSDNCPDFLGMAPDELLGRPLERALGPEHAASTRRALAQADGVERPVFVGRMAMPTRRFVDTVAHPHADRVLLELEAARDGSGVGFSDLYAATRSFICALRHTRAEKDLCALAIAELRKLTGFGRVLAYRFDTRTDDGEVIAEEIASPDIPSYLGLRFPAADIPPQARDLYRLNPVRLIADVDYTPSQLVPERDPRSGAPTDLGRATLRSVSPVHLQYMRNMGTASSMSIPIVIGGRLWGLISCHDAQPRHVGFEQRAVCEHIGQVLSLQIEAAVAQAETEHRLELRQALVRMLAQMAEEKQGFVEGFLGRPERLMGFMHASAAAIVHEGAAHLRGAAIDQTAVLKFSSWLAASRRTQFHTDCIRGDYPDAADFGDDVGGVFAVSISELHDNYVIWFRPPIDRLVRWAGDPGAGGADVRVGELTLPGPRHSFAEWREIVRGCCEPWRPSEADIADELRSAILAIVLRQAEEKAALAAALQEANKELEAFSYSVSHDLRAPLRHITGFANLLRESRGPALDAGGLRYLQNISDAAVFAGLLVDNLLSFSQMGRAALKPRRVNMAELVEKAIADLCKETAGRRVQWKIGALPDVHADPAFLSLALRNLLSNAAKYSRGRDPAVIRVEAEQHGDEVLTHVRDNGVGFSMKYVDKLFGIFQRLHRAEEFEGTGIGLANVKRIIERHGGRVWAEGELDRGAVFSFSLPNLKSTPTLRKSPDA